MLNDAFRPLDGAQLAMINIDRQVSVEMPQ
jgi:hypothetical protein